MKMIDFVHSLKESGDFITIVTISYVISIVMGTQEMISQDPMLPREQLN